MRHIVIKIILTIFLVTSVYGSNKELLSPSKNSSVYDFTTTYDDLLKYGNVKILAKELREFEKAIVLKLREFKYDNCVKDEDSDSYECPMLINKCDCGSDATLADNRCEKNTLVNKEIETTIQDSGWQYEHDYRPARGKEMSLVDHCYGSGGDGCSNEWFCNIKWDGVYVNTESIGKGSSRTCPSSFKYGGYTYYRGSYVETIHMSTNYKIKRTREITTMTCPDGTTEYNSTQCIQKTVYVPEGYNNEQCIKLNGEYYSSPLTCNKENKCGYGLCYDGEESTSAVNIIPYAQHPIEAIQRSGSACNAIPCDQEYEYSDGIATKIDEKQCDGEVVDGKCLEIEEYLVRPGVQVTMDGKYYYKAGTAKTYSQAVSLCSAEDARLPLREETTAFNQEGYPSNSGWTWTQSSAIGVSDYYIWNGTTFSTSSINTARNVICVYGNEPKQIKQAGNGLYYFLLGDNYSYNSASSLCSGYGFRLPKLNETTYSTENGVPSYNNNLTWTSNYQKRTTGGCGPVPWTHWYLTYSETSTQWEKVTVQCNGYHKTNIPASVVCVSSNPPTTSFSKPLEFKEYSYYEYECPSDINAQGLEWELLADNTPPGCIDDTFGNCISFDAQTAQCRRQLLTCPSGYGECALNPSSSNYECNYQFCNEGAAPCYDKICDLAINDRVTYCEQRSCPEGTEEKDGKCIKEECPMGTLEQDGVCIAIQ